MWKPYILFCSILIGLMLLSLGCETPTESDEELDNLVLLTGQVINEETSEPVEGAVVRFINFSATLPILTDSVGRFNYEFDAQETFELQIFAQKENLLSDSINVLIVPGRTINVPLLKLNAVGQSAQLSGEASSIILAGVSVSSIGVRESGSPETTEIIFEVQDSSGIPIDLNHSVTVVFSIGSAPGGGEFIFPESIETSHNGRAKVNLFSGIKSGVVQIMAQVSLNNKTILSQPVAVAIHGGLPDAEHFSVAVEKLNFPGYNIYGLNDRVTAYVGDKYGNPVRPQTSVYFTTTGGLVEGSALTNTVGQASVNLISSAPKPNHPTLGAGFATVTARTANENQETIETGAIVLFSGVPQISINPTFISVPQGGSQSFQYFVQDQNGNPLAEGTEISVSIEAGDIKAVGNIDVSLPDTQSPSWTTFSFSLIDAKPDTAFANQAAIKINTSGPNGSAQISISGVAN
jgi:hypothetical protein